jgi:hypothetical protein
MRKRLPFPDGLFLEVLDDKRRIGLEGCGEDPGDFSPGA